MVQIINCRDIPTDKKTDILNALEQIDFISVYKANNKKFMIKRMNGFLMQHNF